MGRRLTLMLPDRVLALASFGKCVLRQLQAPLPILRPFYEFSHLYLSERREKNTFQVAHKYVIVFTCGHVLLCVCCVRR